MALTPIKNQNTHTTMQLGRCIVRLGGDLNNSVLKQPVTPAEIIVLRAIHGDDAVLKIRQTGQDRRAHAEELQRLIERYGAARGEDEQSIVAKIWPSPHGVKLPLNFKDIGVDIMKSEDDDDDEPDETDVNLTAPLAKDSVFDRPAAGGSQAEE